MHLKSLTVLVETGHGEGFLMLYSVQMQNIFMETLTVWEGGSESSSANRCIWYKFNPQDVTGHRGVVGGESISRETPNQRPRWVPLSYFKEVILTGRPTMQGKFAAQNTRIFIINCIT